MLKGILSDGSKSSKRKSVTFDEYSISNSKFIPNPILNDYEDSSDGSIDLSFDTQEQKQEQINDNLYLDTKLETKTQSNPSPNPEPMNILDLIHTIDSLKLRGYEKDNIIDINANIPFEGNTLIKRIVIIPYNIVSSERIVKTNGSNQKLIKRYNIKRKIRLGVGRLNK